MSSQHGPQLPHVTDEAADTPSWVPLLGLALLLLVGLYVGFRTLQPGG